MFCTTGTVYSYLYDNPHPQFLCSHKHTSGAMCMHMQLGAVYSLAIGAACHWVIFASNAQVKFTAYVNSQSLLYFYSQ